MIYATVEETQAAVDAYNAAHKPGPVKYRFAHEPKPHRLGNTVGPALVSGTSAMVALDVLPGGLSIALVEPIQTELVVPTAVDGQRPQTSA